jgi:LmbE family N-acetylglucosaminyl deacetylase
VHPDHRAVAMAACEAFRRAAPVSQRSSQHLAFFEIGHPLWTNLLVDVSSAIQIKSRAMDCFVSQLAQQRYDEHVLALNRFRSYTLGPGVSHAEAFQLLDAEDLRAGVPGLLAAMQRTMTYRLGQTEA